MAQETEKMMTKEEAENSSSINNVGGEESEAEEGEIVSGNPDDAEALKAMAPPPPPPRHPLEHAWTFWFDNPSAKQKQTAWGISMRPIYTFSTVEDFWGVYTNKHHPSKLVIGENFYCFKDKIKPKWEDPVCAKGGKWTVSFDRGKADTPWLYTLLAMIGEKFEYGDEICGAVIIVRARQDKIALWTKNAANEAAQLSIGKQWKEFLDYNNSIGFIFHEEAKRLDRGAKNRYTV